jgi:hypothetical protein
MTAVNALDIALAISQLVLDWWRLRLTHALWAGFFNERLNLDFEQSLGPTALAGFVVRMVFAQQGIQHPALVCQGVIEVHDLDAVLEAVLGPCFPNRRQKNVRGAVFFQGPPRARPCSARPVTFINPEFCLSPV